MYKVKSPILFLIFNRPLETFQVFNEIRKAKPSVLYIAADGPRKQNQNDLLNSESVKKIVKNIDWPCLVRTRFNNENLGCKMAVSSAISWFFENEEEGIILEDDCLPHVDFFRFCDEMLNRYRNETRVAHITGSNLQDGIKRGVSSYYFSNFTYVWGWASWRRVWKNYDVNLSFLEPANSFSILNNLTRKLKYKLYFKHILKAVRNGQIDTWDYQYTFLNIFNRSLTIVPNLNLISNIGFNANATHTTSETKDSKVPLDKITFPLIHPENISSIRAADEYTLMKITPNTFSVYKMALKQLIKDMLVQKKRFL